MIALETKYHSACLASLYNRGRPVTTNSVKEDEPLKIAQGIILAQLNHTSRNVAENQMDVQYLDFFT